MGLSVVELVIDVLDGQIETQTGLPKVMQYSYLPGFAYLHLHTTATT